MWLVKLKIAIIERDANALGRLLSDVPQIQDAKEIEGALCLLQEATLLMHAIREETLISMRQMKKNLDFLRSTDLHSSKNLDIRL